MKLFKKIRKNIGYWVLERRIKKIKRKRSFYNFNTARKIGVLFNATHQETYLKAKSFIASLRSRGIKVYGLGMVKNQEAIGYFPYQEDINFFAISKLNFIFHPVNSDAEAFINQPMDILIDLTQNDQLPLQYVSGLSIAHFKIGANSSGNSPYYDFVLNIGENKSLDFYLQQLEHYMGVLKVSKSA